MGAISTSAFDDIGRCLLRLSRGAVRPEDRFPSRFMVDGEPVFAGRPLGQRYRNRDAPHLLGLASTVVVGMARGRGPVRTEPQIPRPALPASGISRKAAEPRLLGQQP